MPARRTARPRPVAALALVLLAASLGGCLQMAVRPTPEPTPTPTPAPTPTPGPPTPTPAPTMALVTVRQGDSLTTIARRFSTTPRSIAYWNRDTYPSLDPDSPTYAPNKLQVGWVLRVQPGVVFTPTPAPDATGSGLDITPVPTEYLGPPTEAPSGGSGASAGPSASAGG